MNFHTQDFLKWQVRLKARLPFNKHYDAVSILYAVVGLDANAAIIIILNSLSITHGSKWINCPFKTGVPRHLVHSAVSLLLHPQPWLSLWQVLMTYQLQQETSHSPMYNKMSGGCKTAPANKRVLRCETWHMMGSADSLNKHSIVRWITATLRLFYLHTNVLGGLWLTSMALRLI